MKCNHQWFKIDFLLIRKESEIKEAGIILGDVKEIRVIYNCPNCEQTKIVMVDYNAKTKTRNKEI